MRLLLDTHILLWYVLDDPQLSATARALILDPANEILISPASYWEIAIKVSIGKLALHSPFEDFLDLCLIRYGFAILPVEPRHAARVAGLPFYAGHKDPFDRLLVAQALADGLTLVSVDAKLDQHAVSRLA